MTDQQVDKLLAIMERQTAALEKMAQALSATDEKLNIPHADICTELKDIRRANVMNASIALSQQTACEYGSLSEAIKDVANYVISAKKSDAFTNKPEPQNVVVTSDESCRWRIATLGSDSISITNDGRALVTAPTAEVSEYYNTYNGIDLKGFKDRGVHG